jgi:hypothetical protein
MIKVEDRFKKEITESETYFPFQSSDIYGFSINEGVASMQIGSEKSSSSLQLKENDIVFRDEFSPSEVSQIAIQSEQNCILTNYAKEQMDSIAISYRQFRRYLLRKEEWKQLSQQKGAVVILSPISRNSEKAFNGSYCFLVEKFPVQVGRFTKKKYRFPQLKNDIYLYDKKPYQISRVHFRVEKREDGYYFRDLKSKLGSWVNDVQLSKHGQSEVKLKTTENIIYLGKKSSKIMISLLIK